MKAIFKRENASDLACEMHLASPSLTEDIKKTRIALDSAYAGLNYVLEEELIDSYIYQINALQKRYNHLLMLAQEDDSGKEILHPKASAGACVCKTLG